MQGCSTASTASRNLLLSLRSKLQQKVATSFLFG
jgi:hypothetical protein